jgi:hypothetical protein
MQRKRQWSDSTQFAPPSIIRREAYPMIPALPTPAPEMEHHRGFQTFAAVRGMVGAVVAGAVMVGGAGGRRGDGPQEQSRTWPVSCRGRLAQATMGALYGECSRDLRDRLIGDLGRTPRARRAGHSHVPHHDDYTNAMMVRRRVVTVAK